MTAISMKTILAITTFLLSIQTGVAQTSEYPLIGESMPPFKLNNVRYYEHSIFDPAEVRPKWLVLDFWNKHCTVCVESFPKINQLQKDFKDHIQFLLVGQSDKKYNQNIESIFERYRKTLDLRLSIAYDSALFTQFKIQGVPHVIIVDPKGKVYAITISPELTHEKLQALIEGKQPSFKAKTYDFENVATSRPSEWNYSKMGNTEDGNKEVLYRTVLSIYQGEPLTGTWRIDENKEAGFFHLERADVGQLYCMAFFGEVNWGRQGIYFTHWKYPVLEIKDSTLFNFDYKTNAGLYNYSLIVPKEKATKRFLMKIMQLDLKNYFGFEISEETRMMPCWKLSATEKADNLRSISTHHEGDVGPAGIRAKRISVESILEFIEFYNRDEDIPFINETNLDYIDINFSAAMTEMDDVRKALRKLGLILEKSKKQTKVLVIRDDLKAHNTSN